MSTVRNPSLRSNHKCLIRRFLDVKQGQGWEVVPYTSHVLYNNADIRNGIFVIFKRKKCPTETWRESVGHPVTQHQHTEGGGSCTVGVATLISVFGF